MAKRESQKAKVKATATNAGGNSNNELIVVGIGASAGGLEAFEQFFTNMPTNLDTGMAFVLVQHLDPSHKSLLSDLVQRYTHMQVLEVKDRVELKPNSTYIIPPNKDMALLHGKLHLLEPEASRGLRLPIDFFFRSLAQDQCDRAICIVLAGTGTDGTLGLKAVKEAGGMAMAQDPASAKYDGMPRSAIGTGLVDYILPPGKMPAQLLAYVGHAFGKTASAAPMPQITDALQKIFILLRHQTGHDFSLYKQNTIRRRIERRMAVNQVERIDNYVRYLQQNPIEVDTLFKDLLIGVTNFFRDPEAFEALKTQAVIPLLEEKDANYDVVRVWAPGCSTGEEAYSIAILLREYLDKLKKDFKIQLFATDIDANAIERARAGIYPNNIAADVSPERLGRFFTQTDNDTYQIKKSIRDMVVFAEQDVIKDPPFSKIDLISCRNLLIYMGTDLQKKVLPLFHYALNPGGYLFLGNSESIGEFNSLFEAIDKRWKLYQAKAAAGPRLLLADFSLTSKIKEASMSPAAKGRESETKVNVRELVEQTLLEDYTPAGAIINEKGEALYIHGRTGRYLEPASGEASFNILRMAREGLRLDLTGAIRQAVTQKETARREGLQVKDNGNTYTFHLTVRPITKPRPAQGLLLVLFEDATPPINSEPLPISEAVTDKDRRLVELEREVKAKEEHLQTVIEEMETSNEELKSTNEELQSTNEELETSKEELQSVNEELVTVNMELQKKVDELSQANNDMNNLMAGTGIGTIFVDHRLRLQRFTPAATKIVNLIQTDVGRPVNHIVSNLVNYDGLAQDIRQVLNTLIPREAEVQTQKGEWYLMRILPYRTLENVIEGAVMTFVDVTQLKQMEQQIRRLSQEYQTARELAENILAAIGRPLLVLNDQLKVISASPAFYQVFEVSAQETEGQLVYELGNKQWDIPELRRLLEEILPKQTSLSDFDVSHNFETIGPRTMRLNAKEVRQKTNNERFVLLTIEDITTGEGASTG